MTLTVAELQTVFSADDSNFEQVADAVETRQKALDGSTAETLVTADGSEAERTFEQIRDELQALNQSEARPRLVADVADTLADLDKAERALSDLDSEVARPRIDPKGLQEFNDEATDTAREAAASFDGSMSSAADAIQETLANALVGFGPAGIAAGLAAAAGIGTAIAAAEELATANNDAATAASEGALAIVEGTTDATESFREYATTVREDNSWTVWADEATTNIQALADALDRVGGDSAGALTALASNSLPELQDALAGVNAELEAMDDAELAAGSDGFTQEQLARARALEDELVPALQDAIEKQEESRETALLLMQAEGELTRAEAELALHLDETNRAMDERIAGDRSVAQAEFDLADAVKNTRATMKDAEASERDRRRAVFELSGDILDLAAAEQEASGETRDYNRVIDQNRREFMRAADAAGYTREEARKLAKEYGLIPKRVDTEIRGDGRPARAEANSTRAHISGLAADIAVLADTSRARASIAEILATPDIVIGVDVERSGYYQNRADGAVVDYYADGGMENHVAEIAPAGSWRVWAEPETGGEAYIPLAPSKRARSMEILEETASRMGARVVPQADGSVLSAASFAGPMQAMFTDDQFGRLERALERGAARGIARYSAAQDRAAAYVGGF